VAVEPLESMRVVLAEELPDVDVRAGSAEALPLDAASADAVVAAQAFHWFDLPRALPELWRVLRPGGRLGVIWNDLDVSVEWVAEFNAIIEVPRVGTPHPSQAGRADLGKWFGQAHRAQFLQAHSQTRELLLKRVESMSFVAVQPEEVRADIFTRVTALASTHPQLAGRDTFELPYVTEALWAERADR
jgi:SAM-dependent methyltransferase